MAGWCVSLCDLERIRLLCCDHLIDAHVIVKAENKNEAPQYDGTWRDADPADVKAKMDAGVPYTYRFKVPKGKVRPNFVVVVLGH